MKSPVSAPKRAPFCPGKHVGGLRSHVSISISSQSEYSTRSLKIAPPNSRGSLQIVCTSEHWYEEEEEFDSLTDALKPKTLLLVVPSSDAAAHENEIRSLRESLQTTEFAVGFCSSAVGENLKILYYSSWQATSCCLVKSHLYPTYSFYPYL